MKTKLLITIGIALLISSCDKDNKNDDAKTYSFAGVWVKHDTTFPTSTPINSVSFKLEDAYYVGLGLSDRFNEQQDSFFRFDPHKGWETIKKFPGKTREGATAFVLEGKAYVGLGYHREHSFQNPYLTDFWVYDPAQDSWDSLRMDFPGEGRSGAVAFILGGKAYVGTGYSSHKEAGSDYFGDFYEFSPATGWKKMDQLTVNSRNNAVTFSIHDEIFLCFGTNKGSVCRDVMKLSKASLSWTKVHPLAPKDYPDLPDFVSSFTLNENGKEQVFVYGMNSYSNTWYCYTYSPEKDIWYEVTDFPSVSIDNNTFVIDNTLYHIGGNTTYQFVRKE